MNKTKQALILAIIAAVVTTVGLIAINSFSVSSVQANQSGSGGAQKWEYCAITGASYAGTNFGSRGIAVIRYFQAGGYKDETIEFVPDMGQRSENGIYENGALSKAIAKLGDEGWELVSKEPNTDKIRNIFYFKRPKQ